MSLRLGYGTNGFTNHRLDDALGIIADLGYTGVALTLDHHHLDPFAADLPRRVDAVAARLAALGLAVVIETGARYLLDARTKHHPTLVSEGQPRRVDFLRRAVRIAADLDAECVSFWSGVLPDGTDAAVAARRLADGVGLVLDEAARRGVRLGLEPEPGHVVARLADAVQLRARLGGPELLGITLDVGHCVAVEPLDTAACVRRAGNLLVNVQLDDAVAGVHEHLEFGQGELDLPATLAALEEVGYRGIAAVELPRHSHAAPVVAARALAALRAALPDRSPGVEPWAAAAVQAIRRDPAAIRTLFPAAGREVGRGPRCPATDPHGLVHGTVDDRVRTELLAALPPDVRPPELAELYRYGDDAEKRGVLRGLSIVGAPPEVGLALVADALRSNDIRLVAAALGEYAAEHLDDHSWRHGVLKCLFVEVPLDAVARWADRADAELYRMVADYVAERRAAGREVPADALRIINLRIIEASGLIEEGT